MADNILFRADASASLGIGHVMRCLTLANCLAQVDVKSIFVCRELPLALKERLERAQHRVFLLENVETLDHEVAAISSFIARLESRPKAVVCDHYKRDADWQAQIRSMVERFVVIDDLADRQHVCDLLIDPSVDRQPNAYDRLVPRGTRRLTGSRYAMLRPEFSRLRQQMNLKDNGRIYEREANASRIVVSMGGSDPLNITGFILSALAALEPSARDTMHVDAIVGSSCPHVEELRRQAANLPYHVTVHVDPPDIAKLLVNADLAFGAPGGSSWERCCLGVATILLVFADNQQFIATKLAERGAAIKLGTWPDVRPEAVRDAYLSLQGNATVLTDMRQSARALCDGEGARRVAEAILDYRTNSGLPVRLRSMQEDDAATLFGFQTAPGARAYARKPQSPTWDEHRAWFGNRLTNKTCPIYMVEAGGMPAGMVRLDEIATAEGAVEVSILIDPNAHGQGLGQVALRLLRLRHPDLTVIANVKPENVASQRIFEKAGYRRISPDWYQLPGIEDGAGKR